MMMHQGVVVTKRSRSCEYGQEGVFPLEVWRYEKTLKDQFCGEPPPPT
jgi:hypothetical protein